MPATTESVVDIGHAPLAAKAFGVTDRGRVRPSNVHHGFGSRRHVNLVRVGTDSGRASENKGRDTPRPSH